MNKKTEKAAEKEAASKTIDTDTTSPSKAVKDDSRETATAENSAERMASRTGRGNGGGEKGSPGRVGLRPEPDTLGEREGVTPSDHDLIWTNKSKDRWENGQPSHGDLLKQHARINSEKSEK